MGWTQRSGGAWFVCGRLGQEEVGLLCSALETNPRLGALSVPIPQTDNKGAPGNEGLGQNPGDPLDPKFVLLTNQVIVTLTLCPRDSRETTQRQPRDS